MTVENHDKTHSKNHEIPNHFEKINKFIEK